MHDIIISAKIEKMRFIAKKFNLYLANILYLYDISKFKVKILSQASVFLAISVASVGLDYNLLSHGRFCGWLGS